MKYIGLILLVLLTGCSGQHPISVEPNTVLSTTLLDIQTNLEETEMKLQITIGQTNFTATLFDNVAVDELIDHLNDGDITLSLQDYGGFEKVGPLGFGLTTDNRQMITTNGDIVLYNGNQIVLFYGSNSWSYTPLAHINDLSGWQQALGQDGVTIELSLVDF